MENIWKNQNLSLEILKFLQPEELARLSRVNKKFRELTAKNLLWDVFIEHVYLPTYRYQIGQISREHIGTIDLSLTVVDIASLSIIRAKRTEKEGISKKIYKLIFVEAKPEKLKDLKWVDRKISAIREGKNLKNTSYLSLPPSNSQQEPTIKKHPSKEDQNKNPSILSKKKVVTIISFLGLSIIAKRYYYGTFWTKKTKPQRLSFGTK